MSLFFQLFEYFVHVLDMKWPYDHIFSHGKVVINRCRGFIKSIKQFKEHTLHKITFFGIKHVDEGVGLLKTQKSPGSLLDFINFAIFWTHKHTSIEKSLGNWDLKGSPKKVPVSPTPIYTCIWFLRNDIYIYFIMF